MLGDQGAQGTTGADGWAEVALQPPSGPDPLVVSASVPAPCGAGCPPRLQLHRLRIPGDGARGWELSGESRQLGRWKDLLTVAIDSYEFTGGAHGLPVTRWLNWDLAAHRPVPLGQVIKPGQEDALEAAARRAHDRWLEKEVDSDEDFRQAWPFQESSDFRLTRKGLVLHYDVYSIAPYVMGQPTLTLPWKDLDGVIREEYRPDGGQ